MSPTPIREALRLLQADRLIDYRAHHGIVVAEISAETTEEVYHLRALLEPLAVELAVPALTGAELQELERLHKRHTDAPTSKGGAAVYETNRAWHWAIYEVSGWPILNDLVRQLWEAFPWRTTWALPGRRNLSLEQHEAVMEAIRAGDAALAGKRMREHVTSGRETLVEHLRSELSSNG